MFKMEVEHLGQSERGLKWLKQFPQALSLTLFVLRVFEQ